MDLVVCKFGGTSLATLEHIRAMAERVIEIQRDGRGVVAVLSAMGDSTDQLVKLAHEMTPLPPAREADALVSLGESVSCTLAALAVREAGGRAVSLTGAQAGVHTDDTHGGARLFDIDPERVLEAVGDGNIAFVTGFQGVAPNGDVTTLGRGGSDASAVALAAALGVDECHIFTDVAGVFTADPRVVEGARRLEALSHEEMLVFAAAGAMIVQPRAAELALGHKIDIHVRSAFIAGDGTWIRKGEDMLEPSGITGVAHHNRSRTFAVRDLSAVGVVSALAQRGIAVSTLLRTEGEVRFVVSEAEEADVAEALAAVGARLASSEPVGTVTVVGVSLSSHPDMAARALAALEGIGVDPQLMSSAPGQIAFHVDPATVHDAVRALHAEFRLAQASTLLWT
jgi:aspartate kinase